MTANKFHYHQYCFHKVAMLKIINLQVCLMIKKEFKRFHFQSHLVIKINIIDLLIHLMIEKLIYILQNQYYFHQVTI